MDPSAACVMLMLPPADGRHDRPCSRATAGDSLATERPKGVVKQSSSGQQRFTAFLKDRIAPALRERGLKGSGQAYSLPDEARYLQVGFQKSVHSSADEVSFTINLQAVERSTWEEARTERPWLPERPTPNTRYGPFAWHRRAGLLMPEQRDNWWTVRADTDLDRLTDEILHAFDAWLIPALRSADT